MKQVSVLMSTFNGEQYLGEQIESIMRQMEVEIRLFIRDDGSTDNTLGIIKSFEQKYSGKLFWEQGSNIGYRRSFLQLLKESDTADYYAFADQDDVWNERKLIRAVEMLENLKEDGPLLYASGLLLSDEELQNQTKKIIDYSRRSLEGNFLRSTLAGCTFVFNRALADNVKRINVNQFHGDSMPSHDFLVSSCAYALGKVIIDDYPFIIHRRHSGTQGADMMGWRKRIKVEFQKVFIRKGLESSSADAILKAYKGELDDEAREFLVTVRDNSKKLQNKRKLICYPRFRADNFMINAEAYFKILIGRY